MYHLLLVISYCRSAGDWTRLPSMIIMIIIITTIIIVIILNNDDNKNNNSNHTTTNNSKYKQATGHGCLLMVI